MIYVSYSEYFNIAILKSKTEINNNWIKPDSQILNNYLYNFKGIYNQQLLKDIDKIRKYFSLKILINNDNSSINNETKKILQIELEKMTSVNFSLINNIFVTKTIRFGNQIIALNNLIYYCEILGIKSIFLNSDINWFIKDDIRTNKINISIIPSKKINCNSNSTFCVNLIKFFYPIIIKPKRRTIILKEEIKKNLPKIIVNKEDLYIYIRSGDSFKPFGNGYAPAPYCFYKKVISNFNFSDIIIISEDKESPITKRLLSDYPKIKHQLNSIEIDIATLINAYNLINSFSSFSQAAIAFNDNLNNLFEYEIYRLESAIVHLHYDIDKLDKEFTIYRMKPSENYLIKMYDWKNSDEQRKLLFEEQCKYEIRKTKYTKTIFD